MVNCKRSSLSQVLSCCSFKFCSLCFSSNSTKILFLILISLIYYKVNLHNFAWYSHNVNNPCLSSKEERNQLLALAKDTSTILNNLGIRHFLVYGSLWGSLRYNGPLPWDNDFDYGVLYDEIIQHPEQQIVQHFQRSGINCYYSYRFGFYRVTRGSARGDIMIYRDFYSTGWLHRVGWEAYVFFVNYRYYHMFPADLVTLPMATVYFGEFNVSIPHGGFELQKYHYPNDWWIERKPRGCQ